MKKTNRLNTMSDKSLSFWVCKSRYRVVFVVAFPLVVFCCFLGMHFSNETPADLAEYMQTLANEQKGLQRSRTDDGVVYSVRYIPVELLAYREMRKSGMASILKYDSLRVMYEGTEAFELRLSAAPPNQHKDVMFKNISTDDEYSERAELLNFRMEEMLKVRVGERVYSPSLAVAENTYSLNQQRVVLVLFANEGLSDGLKSEEQVRFTFSDQLFGTGMQHFTFATQDIVQRPEFPIEATLYEFAKH